MKIKNRRILQEQSFGLQLIIIAILIPVFLISFPNLVESLLSLISFFPIPFTFNIVKITSIFLGLSWFLVLIIGLIEFQSKPRKIFDLSFKLASFSTVILIFAVIGSYFLYILNLIIGYEKIINSIALILVVVLAIISIRSIKN